MIDYSYKSYVLKTDMPRYISFLSRKYYKFGDDFKLKLVNNDGLVYDLTITDEMNYLYNEYGFKFIKECQKINHASFIRSQRLRDRIASYLNKGQCIFVTLTFRDDVLDQTNVSTRRKYVSRFLKSISDYYVANIDYGVDDRYTHREHYHALIVVDWIDSSWEYGFTWFERVHDYSNPLTLSKYVSKLCNHAIKDSTTRACYIYSRCK